MNESTLRSPVWGAVVRVAGFVVAEILKAMLAVVATLFAWAAALVRPLLLLAAICILGVAVVFGFVLQLPEMWAQRWFAVAVACGLVLIAYVIERAVGLLGKLAGMQLSQ